MFWLGRLIQGWVVKKLMPLGRSLFSLMKRDASVCQEQSAQQPSSAHSSSGGSGCLVIQDVRLHLHLCVCVHVTCSKECNLCVYIL